MSDSHVIITDIGSLTLNNENGVLGSNIKQEVVNEDEILLLTPEMVEAFSGDPNNFHLVEQIVSNTETISETGFNMSTFDEGQMSQLLSDENLAKFPIDLGEMCKFENSGKQEGSAHVIKYKLQDGKHSKVWECGICAKEFGHQYTLMRHLPTHTDERKFQCNICGKAFRQMSTLSQHRAIHSAERPYVCEVCHKTFNRVSTLISHRKTHTGLKPHRCHLCNKAFHQKGNLRNHVFTHTNERPYKCDICNKGFNQMSNLMCHKVKAHQRSDKPRYICQICGKDFQKRMGLRNHEQYQHGIQNPEATTSSASATRVKYTNGVLVDPINTAAMQHALATNQTPFALLRPLNGIPVLVRVLSAGDKQMLVPATAEDLKKHGQITINSQIEEQNKTEQTASVSAENEADNDDDKKTIGKTLGSTVQIKIPVVATVVQRCGKDGNVCMAIESPGPDSEGMISQNQLVKPVFTVLHTAPQTTTLTAAFDPPSSSELNNDIQMQTCTQIQYISECGQILNEEETKDTFLAGFQFGTQNDVFSANFQLDNGLLNLSQNHDNILKDVDTQNVMDISYAESNTDQMFEMLDKPQIISLSDTDSILETSNVLYDTNMDTDFLLQ